MRRMADDHEKSDAMRFGYPDIAVVFSDIGNVGGTYSLIRASPTSMTTAECVRVGLSTFYTDFAQIGEGKESW